MRQDFRADASGGDELVNLLAALLRQLETLNERLAQLEAESKGKGMELKAKRPKALTMSDVMERLQIGRNALQRLIYEEEDFVTMKVGQRRLMTEKALQEFIFAKEREERPYKRLR